MPAPADDGLSVVLPCGCALVPAASTPERSTWAVVACAEHGSRDDLEELLELVRLAAVGCGYAWASSEVFPPDLR